MKNYKICVYAISKNESQFVSRWVESMQEADAIYVLDTGSTDDTVKKLKQKGVKVTKKEIKPWRFDVARNESLKLLPKDTDICVCTDLDEVFEPGWRQKLEEKWNENVTRAKYNYNWSFDEYGNPAVNFYIEKIHKRKGYKWVHPVHEVLQADFENDIIIDDITLNHYPDSSKSRGNYLPLLELSVKEDPEDDRNMHYLGREYMYYKKWNECIDTLIKHLALKSATWKDERSASMRFISRAYINLSRPLEAKMWLELAKKETPYLREPFVEDAFLEYSKENYEEAINDLKRALNLEKPYKNYINEPFCYDGTIYDILSLSLFYAGIKEEALIYAVKALEKDPKNERIQNNIKLIEESIKSPS